MAAWVRYSVVVPMAAWCLVSSCAFDLADVRYAPTQFEHRPGVEQSFVLADETPVKEAPCGYRRTLHKGTQWKLVGALPEGEVFKSQEQALTLECSNVFEAYLVLSGKSLVGFYLPVEKGFVALRTPLPLHFTR